MTSDRPNSLRYRGSIYLYVLSSSLLITIIGLASLAAVRIQTRSAWLSKDYAAARACATSAVELGVFYVTQDPNWRTTRSNGVWVQDQALGAGHFTLQGVDPGDGALNDSAYEPLVLTGTGTKGVARHKAEVTLVPVIQPLEALGTCLHASGLVFIKAGKWITAAGAPVSTNGQLNNDGTLDGDAHAETVDHTGTITGTFTLPAPNKEMPNSSVIAGYQNKATLVPYTGTIDEVVLAPGCNPWGVPDPNGLYYISTSGGNLTIKNSRIYGTLIVDVGAGTLTLDTTVFFQNYRSDFPVLLVEGKVVIKIRSCDTMLSEVTDATNYNPVGAPYGGAYDSDTLDVYPNEIRGLVHIVGELNLQQTSRIVGTVICDGPVTCEDTNTIIYNASLYASPPQGYTDVAEMKISPRSWRQVVD